VRIFLAVLLAMGMIGCSSGFTNQGRMTRYITPEVEATWIREGEPIKFEDELWYPQDKVDILKDDEVLRLGAQNGIEFFIDKIDVRPYNRLYTKFGKNTFRVFQKNDD